MTAQLFLAPVGSGKTEQALERIANTTAAKPFAQVWVLLATDRQINEFRNRLIASDPNRHVYFNVSFFTFYQLYSHILASAGQPTRELGQAARLRLLRMLAKQMAERGDLPTFEPIAHKPGFVRMLADFIYELKGGLIDEETFTQAVNAVFEHPRPKDIEVVQLYAAYQERLREHDVVDREGAGWLALDELDENEHIATDVDLVVVDGYDQFTPLQAQFIALLSTRVPELMLTLTTVPQREHQMGRRFESARQTLSTTFEQFDIPLTQIRLTEQVERRHLDLQHLTADIFRAETTPTPSTGGIRFVTAPDEAQETAAILRQVKHLLTEGIDGRVPAPDDVLIVLRDYQRYRVHLQIIGESYGLPLAMHLGEPLADTPPIHALMNVLTLHSVDEHLIDFPRRLVLDALNSPYFSPAGLDEAAVAQLERISAAFAVTGGRAIWLDALEQAKYPRISGDDNQQREIPPLLDEASADALAHDLAAFFDAITPPQQATVDAYIQWIEGIIGADPERDTDYEDDDEPAEGVLKVITTIRHTPTQARILGHDIAALDVFKRMLRDLLSAQVLIQTLEDASQPITWAEFFADLRTALSQQSIESRPSRGGRVLITTAADARGLPHAHVFIMGLSEGVFPARITEDPLYLDIERHQLKAYDVPLATTADRATDDSRFFELISLARDTLTLSRPTVKNGGPWVESHLWRAAAAVFSDSTELLRRGETRLGAIPSWRWAATVEEVARFTAHGLSNTPNSEAVKGTYNWLLQNHQSLWDQIVMGYTAEFDRINRSIHSRYTGKISDPKLLEALQKRLGVNHSWSASQMNDYGLCPFRFFAQRLLRLEPLEEPAVGMDSLQLGLINHKILERTYRQVAEHGLHINADHLDQALGIFEAVAAEVLPQAPRQFGFRASPLWQQEQVIIVDRLRKLVTYDFTGMNDNLKKMYPFQTRQPYALEPLFGLGQKNLHIRKPNGDTIVIYGYIDRIDRLDDAHVLVIDYKTGTTKILLSELEEGRNFQIMLYLRAAKHLIEGRQQTEPDPPTDIAGGLFWHIGNRSTSGELINSDPTHQQIIAQAEQRIIHYVDRALSGDFTVSPSKPQKGKCVSYCPFQNLCRLAVTNRNKL